MSSIKKADIKSWDSLIQVVDFDPGTRPYMKLLPNANNIIFKQYHTDFETVAGREPQSRPEWSILLSSDDSSKNPFFHGGCAYIPEKDELYITSDLLQSTSSSLLPTILISKINFRRGPDNAIQEVEWMKLRPPSSMTMPAGACHYENGVLYCSQGTQVPESGGLWYMPAGKPPIPILTSYFHKPFNSIQNVVRDMEGGLWFTDTSIGFEKEIRPLPMLPNQVYHFDPRTRDLCVVADGFMRPTGIAIDVMSAENTLYVTDTGAAHANGTNYPPGPATIYAFDVIRKHGRPFAANKRVFAYVKEGVPTAIICDHQGNVFAACGDGVEVWSPGGLALGLIEVPGGCTDLCFGKPGEIFICAQQRLWRVQLKYGAY
ncbi:calcium-dependent phosphotriesterase [Annulohypoxylon maeteangense]|uniref:calcium-dependent phosphotriesterase n=1 Tax=Annulohypoxylon maeteangense TaxID=1927788 RepID=UPI00200828AF|nr:calcium-dependent phosphotriesterase [Annulohypoxylon maeteangense]KAI0890283.1 calcium-dependent phosphotriesterase [Annulohypoxylon maeteangense]